MNPLPFRYEDWLKKTSGGPLSSRSRDLKALDAAIRAYDRAASVDSANEALLLAVREALMAYVADEEARSGVDTWKRGPRNRDRIIEKLAAAVGLGTTADHRDVQAFAQSEQMVPTVVEPDVPALVEPPLPRIDLRLEARAEQLKVRPAARPASSRPSAVQELASPASAVPPAPGPQVHRPAARVPHAMPTAPAELAPLPDALHQEPHLQSIVREVDALGHDLLKLKVRVNDKVLHRVNFFHACVQEGFKVFEELHTQDAEATEFKLSLAKSAFDALAAAPFPFSILGQIGSAGVSALKTDKQFTALRVELPTPGGIMGEVEKAADQFTRWRTLNVPPSDLMSQHQLWFSFLNQVHDFRTKLDEAFDTQSAPLNDRHRRMELAKRLAANPSRTATDPTADAVAYLKSLEDAIKRLFDDFLRVNDKPDPTVSAWITVQMIADYAITGLCKDEDVTKMTVSTLGGKPFGAPFARFLGTPQVGVVELKLASGTSRKIYGNGKIPWNGSPNHNIAIILYLDWFRREINPFRMLTGSLSPAKVKSLSREYILDLGAVMMTHKTNPFTDVAGIHDTAKRLGGPGTFF